MAKSPSHVFEIKVSLNYVNPPVWRRLLVSPDTDLGNLHAIIQIAMGWTDSHLHQFISGDTFYGVPEPYFANDTVEESGVPISSLLREPGDSIIYEYDFGDGWVHTVELVEVRRYAPGVVVPSCLTGEHSCPPEDVGGPPGYLEFLKAYQDETHPEHEDMVEWAGDDFDPNRLDVDEVNDMLAGIR